jgi:hypothetical protein
VRGPSWEGNIAFRLGGACARLLSFIVQGVGFAGLWWLGNLTVSTATYTLICAQTASTLLANICCLASAASALAAELG